MTAAAALPRYRYTGDDVRVFSDFSLVVYPGDVFEDERDLPVPEPEDLAAMRLEVVAKKTPLVSNAPVDAELVDESAPSDPALEV